MRKQITMRDIARITGVSPKTVSRVVNNQGEISEVTRQRVQEAIEALGYSPNITARSLVQGRSNTIAVVAWGIEYYGPSRVVVGIERQADEYGYSLLLTLLRSKETDQKIRDTLKDLAARRVDGIIFAIPEFNDNRAWIDEEVLNRLPPIVFLNMESRPGINIVSVDNKAGARLATSHLLEQGRKNIATICGPLRWWEARQRLAGWKEVLDHADLPAPAEMIAEGDWSAESGERAMRQLLETASYIDAAFVANDQMALGALGVLHQREIRVPDDIAVIGFDNVPDAAYYYPPLSTVDQPLLELGKVGVQKLHQMITIVRHGEDGMEKSTTLLMPKMIVRQSSSIDADKRL